MRKRNLTIGLSFLNQCSALNFCFEKSQVIVKEINKLLDELENIKKEYVGKPFNNFPLPYGETILAKDDDGDTDLYQCYLHSESLPHCTIEIAFWTSVFPDSFTIENVDLTSADIFINGNILLSIFNAEENRIRICE